MTTRRHTAASGTARRLQLVAADVSCTRSRSTCSESIRGSKLITETFAFAFALMNGTRPALAALALPLAETRLLEKAETCVGSHLTTLRALVLLVCTRLAATVERIVLAVAIETAAAVIVAVMTVRGAVHCTAATARTLVAQR